MVSLDGVKINKNETVEEFNNRFNQIVQRLHTYIKPPKTTIFIYYLDAFDGYLSFKIREKYPQNLKATQDSTIKIDKKMIAYGSMKLYPPSPSKSSKATKSKLHQYDENHNVKPHTI